MFGSGFNQNQQSTFGSTNTGFGNSTFGNTGYNSQPNNSLGFGQSAFGSNNNTNTNNQTSAFGTNTGFGSKPFGQSNSLFGSNQPSTSTFGFNNNATTSAFGGGNTFGGSTNSFLNNNNTSAFGNTTSAFGKPSTTGGFGGFGSSINTQNQGTGNPPYSIHTEKEPNIPQPSNFHSITAIPAYRNFSFEELRLKDYQMNKKFPSNNTGFGSTTSAFGGGSSFMNNNTNSAFGQKPAFGSTTSTFGQPQTNTFGTSNNAFGSNTNTGTGLFGSSNTNTGFGQMNNNTSTGFGSSLKPSTGFSGGFGSSGFGSNTNNTTSAFGNTNTSTGMGFGNTNNTTNAFGNTTNTFGSGVNTSMPLTNSTGFGFGATSQPTSTFNKPATSTGLFNSSLSTFGNNTTTNPTNTSTGLFGNTNTFGSNTGTSLFNTNNTTNTNTGGLFGSKPATTGFNTGLNFNKPASSAMPATSKPVFSFSTGNTGTGFGTNVQSNSLFQSKPTMSTGLTSFNTKTPAPTGTGLFSSTTNTFGGGLNQTTMNQQPLQASIDNAPYGINPLFDSMPSTNTTSTYTSTQTQNSTKAKKDKNYSIKLTSKTATHIKLQGFSTPTTNTKSNFAKKTVIDNKRYDDPNLVNKFITRKSVKKLVITKDNEKQEEIKPVSSIFSSSKNSSKKINFNENLEISLTTPNKGNQSQSTTTPFNYRFSSDSSKLNTNGIFLTPSKNLNIEKEKVSVNLASTKKSSYINDYIVSPSLSEMNGMTNEELKHVKDLIVTYPDVGSVHFLEPVDLLSASPTGERSGIPKIFGSIIIIEPKVCTVYPGEKNKPEVGKGLNVPAHIELLKCWAVDKATRKPILDEEHPKFKRLIKKLKTMPETEFNSFDVETGCWAFNVKHFSKYGLKNDDDDDDDEYYDEQKRKEKKFSLKNSSSTDLPYEELEVDGFEIVSESDEDSKKNGLNSNEKQKLIEKLETGELKIEAEEEIDDEEENEDNSEYEDEENEEEITSLEESNEEDEEEEGQQSTNKNEDQTNENDKKDLSELKTKETNKENSIKENSINEEKNTQNKFLNNKRKLEYNEINKKRICNNDYDHSRFTINNILAQKVS